MYVVRLARSARSRTNLGTGAGLDLLTVNDPLLKLAGEGSSPPAGLKKLSLSQGNLPEFHRVRHVSFKSADAIATSCAAVSYA